MLSDTESISSSKLATANEARTPLKNVTNDSSPIFSSSNKKKKGSRKVIVTSKEKSPLKKLSCGDIPHFMLPTESSSRMNGASTPVRMRNEATKSASKLETNERLLTPPYRTPDKHLNPMRSTFREKMFPGTTDPSSVPPSPSSRRKKESVHKRTQTETRPIARCGLTEVTAMEARALSDQSISIITTSNQLEEPSFDTTLFSGPSVALCSTGLVNTDIMVLDSISYESGFSHSTDNEHPQGLMLPDKFKSINIGDVKGVDNSSSVDSLDMARIISNIDDICIHEQELPNTSKCLFESSDFTTELDTAFIEQGDDSVLAEDLTTSVDSMKSTFEALSGNIKRSSPAPSSLDRSLDPLATTLWTRD